MSSHSENIALLETIAEYSELAERALLVQHSTRNALHYLAQVRKLTAKILNQPPLTTLTTAEAVQVDSLTVREGFHPDHLQLVRDAQRQTF